MWSVQDNERGYATVNGALAFSGDCPVGACGTGQPVWGSHPTSPLIHSELREHSHPSSRRRIVFFKEKKSLLHGDYHMKIDLIII